MRPLKLTIENINSFRTPQTIDFAKLSAGENMFCIYGDTGSGKSTIFDCITFALFSKSSSRGVLTDIINLKADSAKVDFEFEMIENGECNVYVASRSIFRKSAKNSSTLTKNGVSIASGADCFKVIGELIGLDCEQFTKVVLLEQGKFDQFLTSTNEVRSNILSKLLNLTKYKEIKKVVSENIKELTIKINQLKSQLEIFVSQGINKENLEVHSKEIASITIELEKHIDEQKLVQSELDKFNEKKSLSDAITKQNAQVKLAKENLIRKQGELSKLPPFDKNANDKLVEEHKKLCEVKPLLDSKIRDRQNQLDEYKKIQGKIALIEKDQERNDKLIKNASSYLKNVLSDGDVCPVCGGKYHKEDCAHGGEVGTQLASQKKIDGDIDVLTHQLDGIKEAGAKLKKEIDELESKTASHTEIAGKISELSRKLQQAELNQKREQEGITELATLKANVESSEKALVALGKDEYDKNAVGALSEKLRELSIKVRMCNETIGKAQRNIALIEENLPKVETISAEKKELDKKFKLQERLQTFVKNNDFFDFVANEYIVEFSSVAGGILQKLTGGLYSLLYDEQEFYIVDYINDGQHRKVKTLSGGETFSASISIAIAIMQYISVGKNFEFFFLDEGFGTLHADALETILGALRELSKDVTVGIISHMSGIRENVSNCVHVIHATEESGSLIEIE